jgi:hypothetical protein
MSGELKANQQTIRFALLTVRLKEWNLSNNCELVCTESIASVESTVLPSVTVTRLLIYNFWG